MNCNCAICKNDLEFEIPPQLVNDFAAGKVVVFAGAGISTENQTVLNESFYERIAGQLGQAVDGKSFPSLMQEYCALPNGRLNLLTEIKNRFKHIRSFPELYRAATRFHKVLATMFPIDVIVTTNWDTYFEDECGATPFVSDEDLAFWQDNERRVLKIHGSVNSHGSIVATTDDYKKCQRRLHKGVIGSKLKILLATRTVVFVGYSFTDSDFLNVYEFVSAQMRGLKRAAYVISPFEEECTKFSERELLPIRTDPTYFFIQLKNHFVNQELMLPDDMYEYAAMLRSMVGAEHEKFTQSVNVSKYPQAIYAASYQDGMMHALERVCELRCTGELSDECSIRRVFVTYLKLQQTKLREGKYEDVAYIEGYMNAFIFLLFLLKHDEKEDCEDPPLYYAFGVNDSSFGRNVLMSYEEFMEIIEDLPNLHKASYKRAKRWVKSIGSADGITFHHFPWL